MITVSRTEKTTYGRRPFGSNRSAPVVACVWEENECKVDTNFSPSVGDTVVVGSGVEWKEDWREVQKQEEKKDEDSMIDEHIQGVNTVHDVPYL